MKFQRLLIVALFAGAFLSAIALGFTSAVTAQDKTQQTTQESKTTPVGFPTGSKCLKTGTYQAENKFMKVVVFMAEGEDFPLFADGEKTMWYALTPSTKSTFEPVKTTADPN